MAHFIFTCPATSMKVQHWLDDRPDVDKNEYEGVVCPACAGLHLINRKNRKPLGQEKQ
jgi:hypothetical protein